MKVKTRERGFTLAEILVVVVLMGIIAMAMTSMVRVYQSSFAVTRDDAEVIENANFAMSMITRDLRGITPDFNIIIANDGNSLRVVDPSNTTVMRYQFVGSELRKDGNVLAGNISNVDFDWLDGNERCVTIQIELVVNNEEIRLNNSVRPRNLE